jgi:hypothetical protein
MQRGPAFLLGGLLVALALAALSPLASKNPDGLEHVAEKHEIAVVESARVNSPIPDYWESEGPAKKIAAGLIGTVLVFGLTFGLGAVLKKKKAAS